MTCTAFRVSRARQLAILAPMALSVVVPAARAQSVTLPEGMAIQLETRQDVSSKSARVGDQVELAVAKPVTVSGITIIEPGTTVVGEVTHVRDNGLFGRSGKLDIKISTLNAGQLAVPVRGQRSAKGKPGTIGAVGAGIVFLPLAALVRGKDVKLPAGTTFDVYVDRAVAIPAEVSATALAPTPDSAAAPSVIKSVDPNEHLAQ